MPIFFFSFFVTKEGVCAEIFNIFGGGSEPRTLLVIGSAVGEKNKWHGMAAQHGMAGQGMAHSSSHLFFFRIRGWVRAEGGC
ncbi:hypothetical protein HDV64DRAFT_238523, partial [Trichoderma sp. TUCIM 5745]